MHRIPIPPVPVPTLNPNPNNFPLSLQPSAISSSSSSSSFASVIIAADVAAPSASSSAIIRPPLAIPLSSHAILPHSSSPPRAIANSPSSSSSEDSDPPIPPPHVDHRYCSGPPAVLKLPPSSSSTLLLVGNSDIHRAGDPARRSKSAVTNYSILPSYYDVSGSHNHANQQQQQQQQQDQIAQTLSGRTSTDPADPDRSLLQNAGAAAADPRHLRIDCNISDGAISDRCNSHYNDRSEDEDASAEDQQQHLIYALRRNPKRNRRLSDQDLAAASTGPTEMMAIDKHDNKVPLATADDHHQNQIKTSSAAEAGGGRVAAASNDRDPDCNYRSISAAFASPNCHYAALAGAERISHNCIPSSNSPASNDNSNTTNNHNQRQQQQQQLRKSSVFASLQEKARPACSECGKEFQSWKALFGHMRCHPERDWRGIQPPPPAARHSSNAFDSRKLTNHHGIRRSSAAEPMASSRPTTPANLAAAASPLDLQLQTEHHHFPPPKPAAIRSGKSKKAAIISCDDPCKPIVLMNDGTADRNRREAASQSPYRKGGRDVHAQYWEEQEVSLEEEEESETESIEAAYLSCSSGSKDINHQNNKNNMIRRSGEDVDLHKSSQDADHFIYRPAVVSSSPSSMAARMRGKRSRRSHPTLKSLKSMEFADDLHFASAKCKINPGVTADYSRAIASRDRDQIGDEVEMANCLIMLALAGSFVEMKEDMAEEKEGKEEDIDAIDVVAGGNDSEIDPALREKQLTSMRECRRSRSGTIDIAVDDVAAAAVMMKSVGEDQRFECGTCCKVFRSHQALGGHRASHKKVKGCFARAPPLDLDLLQVEGGGGATGNSVAMEVADAAADLQVDGCNSSCSRHRKAPSFEDAVVDYSECSLQQLPKQQENIDDDLLLLLKQKNCGGGGGEPAVAAHHHYHGAGGAAPAAVTTKLLSNKSHQCSICFRVFSSGQALGGHKRCHWSADKAGGGGGGGGAAEGSPPAAAAAAASIATNYHHSSAPIILNSISKPTDRLPMMQPEPDAHRIKSSEFCKTIKVDLDLNLPAPPDDHEECGGRTDDGHYDYQHHRTNPSQLRMLQNINADVSHGKSATAAIAGLKSVEVNGRDTNRFSYDPTSGAGAPLILLDSPARSAEAEPDHDQHANELAHDHFENTASVSAIIDSGSTGAAAAKLSPCIPV